MLAFKALAPLSSWQDDGRAGYQHLGISEGGCLDFRQRDLARLLLGKPLLSIELGQGQSSFYTDEALDIVLTGQRLNALLNQQSIVLNKVLQMKPLQTLSLENAGRLAYLHLAGQPSISPVWGSYSQHGVVDMGLPALKKSEAFDFEPSARNTLPKSGISSRWMWENNSTIRLVQGPDFHLFEAKTVEKLVEIPFSVSNTSSRMGYRMEQPLPFERPIPGIVSASVCKGIIQVSNNGTPMVLMNDCQVTGGYPRIAFVAALDLPKLANLLPGQFFHFEWINAEENLVIWQKYQASLRKINYAFPLSI